MTLLHTLFYYYTIYFFRLTSKIYFFTGMHPTWNIKEHKSIMKLKYDAPLPLSAEENQKATHAAWLLGNEEGLCATSSLKIEVVDFDFVGDHDEVSSLHLNVDDILNKAPLVTREQWFVMTPPPGTFHDHKNQSEQMRAAKQFT